MAVEGQGEGEGEGEELEYESDPEDALHPSAMRRREASDDEDAEGSDGRGKPGRSDLRAGIGSDDESDGQGGALAYEDEEEFDAEEEEEESEEEAGEQLEDEAELEDANREEGDGGALGVEGVRVVVDQGSGGDGLSFGGEPAGYEGKIQAEDGEEKEEKVENEPFAVPTAGAFYMHDDRFRENGRGRRRRMPGARKSWESKDDRAWVHDRFEEMNFQDARHGEERRTSKGHVRAHGNSRTRSTDHGYVRGNISQSYDDNNNQNRAPRSMRGRGPRWYEPLPKNYSEIPAAQNKQSAKSRESTSNTSAGRPSSHTSNVQPDPVLHRNHVFASSLNSASPPFYPSGSSNKDMSVTKKRDAQTRTISRTSTSPMQVGGNFSTSQSGSLLRGKSIVDSVGHDRGYKNDYTPVAGKSSVSSQLQSSGSYISSSSQTQPHSRYQGRGGIAITGPMNHQPTTSVSQITPVSVQTQTPLVQQKPVQTPFQASLRTSTQKMSQRSGSGTQASSPPQAPSANSFDVGEIGYPPVASKSNIPLVMGKISNHGGSNTGSFLYGGAAQVLGATGAMGLPHGDQSFRPTPALLPVMQFGGQHHGGVGVPAVGMALPGYVAQPGFGNNEMTWVPVLAGAAGALGASYPYIALDNSFYARSSGQTSSSTSSSSETGTTKSANTWKSPQGPETVNDEFGQRQNKPRRYSEMNFGQ